MPSPESYTVIEQALAALESDRFYAHQQRDLLTLPAQSEKAPVGTTLGRIMLSEERYGYDLTGQDLEACHVAAEAISAHLETMVDATPGFIDYLAARRAHPNAQIIFSHSTSRVEYVGFVQTNSALQEYLQVPTSIRDLVELNTYLGRIRNERYRPNNDGERKFKFDKPEQYGFLHMAIGVYAQIASVAPNGQYI